MSLLSGSHQNRPLSVSLFILFFSVWHQCPSTFPRLWPTQTPAVSTSSSAISLQVDLRGLGGQPPTHLPGVCERRHTVGCSSPDTQQEWVQPQLHHIWKSQTSIRQNHVGAADPDGSEWFRDKEEVVIYKYSNIVGRARERRRKPFVHVSGNKSL